MSLFNFFKAKRKEPEKPIINYDRVNLDIYHDNAFIERNIPDNEDVIKLL